MRIQTKEDYIDFYINLEMQDSVNLLSFINNEKMVLKQKSKNKNIKRDPILNGIKILEELIEEIKQRGEKQVLEKYQQ